MEPIQKIIVSIDFGNEELQLGELIHDGKGIFFKYYTDFIKSRIEISPFHLALADKIYIAPPQPFEGLFGVLRFIARWLGAFIIGQDINCKRYSLAGCYLTTKIGLRGLKRHGCINLSSANRNFCAGNITGCIRYDF